MSGTKASTMVTAPPPTADRLCPSTALIMTNSSNNVINNNLTKSLSADATGRPRRGRTGSLQPSFRRLNSVSRLMPNIDFSSNARRLSQLLPPPTTVFSTGHYNSSQNNPQNSNSNNNNGGNSQSNSSTPKKFFPPRFTDQMSFRRLSNSAKKASTGAANSGRSLFSSTLRARFGGESISLQIPSSDEQNRPLIRKLDKYSADELREFRQVFNMFDADRSGAIGLDELENAITNLGMDPSNVDLESLIREADKRGNHQIDFDEFCEVMQTMTEKNRSWNEVIRECFAVFDRTESGMVSRKDFEFVLREMGGIKNHFLIDELFAEFDVDSDGFIDFDEFSFLVKNYLTDDDVS